MGNGLETHCAAVDGTTMTRMTREWPDNCFALTRSLAGLIEKWERPLGTQ
jgi:hypothetical protein